MEIVKNEMNFIIENVNKNTIFSLVSRLMKNEDTVINNYLLTDKPLVHDSDNYYYTLLYDKLTDDWSELDNFSLFIEEEIIRAVNESGGKYYPRVQVSSGYNKWNVSEKEFPIF